MKIQSWPNSGHHLNLIVTTNKILLNLNFILCGKMLKWMNKIAPERGLGSVNKKLHEQNQCREGVKSLFEYG